ncbi:Indoleamine 2,3-dioxygenase [Teratosphaeria nubilosa]|uniref:Indoleamine 2,3-dioxygenase n=1 Tax=Teratosphaeria nubilosa TaxID=161662 RepID=A0A6G1LMG0_9PEZI|nr:Indoleamine 2,3-dioxygenase [Teratosphaeria nubilosa]
MPATIPKPEDYDVSSTNGFLSATPPLESLPQFYQPWEYIVKNLQGLILSKRLHEVVDRLPILATDKLLDEAEWKRAYSVLAFIAHAYIWGGEKPMEWVPPPVTVPFLQTCKHLELPPVATYAGLVLWNWKPIFSSENIDTLANLDMIDTFTGSLDEKWFYIISVAIEARGAGIIPLMLHAMQAAKRDDRAAVTDCLRSFAERLDELGAMLVRMYDNCDPHVFYHRLRPFLAGSKNMADAGLPNGVVFDDGGPINKQRYVQFSGGSNAQSSLIQFFDMALSVQHRPTGDSAPTEAEVEANKKKAPQENFIHEMRRYMPGPHARFLADVEKIANIRAFVEQNKWDRSLAIAFDACLAMLSAFRDKHIQIVSRYIIIKSREAKAAKPESKKTDEMELPVRPKSAAGTKAEPEKARKDLRGTGGTSLIPFLRQARDETGEPAVDAWAKRVIGRTGRTEKHRRPSKVEVQGLATLWTVDDSEGGLCLV